MLSETPPARHGFCLKPTREPAGGPVSSAAGGGPGADPNARDSRGWTPLHWASKIDVWWTEKAPSLSVYDMLLKAGANPNARDAIGRTPLHMVVATRNVWKIGLLLKAGGDLNVQDRLGNSPFYFAIDDFDSGTVSWLIDAGAEIEARDEDGWTPLHFAAHAGQTAALNALVDAGADGKARTNDRETPFDLVHDRLKGTDALKRLRAARFE